jgi:ABC-type nitrate/sulfonate/bicarbonate transport system permease component
MLGICWWCIPLAVPKMNGWPWLAALTVLLGWHWLTVGLPVGGRVLPTPAETFSAFWADRAALLGLHLPYTLAAAGIGLLLACGLGLVLAALLDTWASLRRALYPLLVLSQTVPLVAIAPLLILALGFGLEIKIVVVILFTFFPITLSSLDAMLATPPALMAHMRSLGATRWQTWRYARLPWAMPAFFSGLRVAATYACSGAVLGEFITAQYGLGRYLRSAFNSGQPDKAFAAIALCALTSIGLVALVNGAARLAIPYFYAERQYQTSQQTINRKELR